MFRFHAHFWASEIITTLRMSLNFIVIFHGYWTRAFQLKMIVLVISEMLGILELKFHMVELFFQRSYSSMFRKSGAVQR